MSGISTQVFTIITGRGVIRLAQFATFVLLARFLSPEAFGWFGILTTAFVLTSTIGSLGFRQSFAYEIGQGRMTAAEANGTTLVLWPFFVGLSAAVVILIYGQQVPGLSDVEAAAVIVAGVAGTMFLTLIQGTFLGRGEISAFTLSESFPRVVLLVIVGGLALGGSLSLSSALWANAVSFAAMIPLALWIAGRGTGRLTIQLKRLRWMVGYGLIFAVNLFLITLSGRLAMFVIEHHYGAAEAGQFFAAIRVNEIFLEVAAAVGMVLFSDAARRQSNASVVARNARIACGMFWLFAVLAVIVAVAAPLLVTVVLGSEYSDAAPALQILAVGLAPAAANKIVYPTFAGSGKPFLGTPVIFAGLSFNVVLALLLVPELGVVGGAIGVVAGQFTIFAGYVVLSRRVYAVPLRTMVLPRANDLRSVGGRVRTRLRT